MHGPIFASGGVAVPSGPLEDYVTVDGFSYIPINGNIFEDDLLATAINDVNGGPDGVEVRGVTDLAGDTYDATSSAVATEYPTWVQGQNALAFDGTNDLLRTTKTIIGSAGTMFARFRSEVGAAGTDVLIGSANGANRTWLSVTDGVISAGIGSTGSDSFKDTGLTDLRSATVWHTGAITWDNTDIRLYLDGVQVNTTAQAGTLSTNTIYIGARHTGATIDDNWFDGEISHWVCDDRAMSASEILGMHTTASATSADPGHRFWRLKGTTAGGYDGGALDEIEFYDTIGGVSIALSGLAGEGSALGSNYAFEAFDGVKDIASYWAGASGAVAAGTSWLSYDFNTPVEIAQFELTSRAGGSITANQMWDAWDLEWSDDYVTWTLQESFSDGRTWGNTESVKYTVS